MIVVGQRRDKIIIDPKVIKINDHDKNEGGYIYVDGELMAYYPDIEKVHEEFARLEQDLIIGRKGFEFEKRWPHSKEQDQPTKNIISL